MVIVEECSKPLTAVYTNDIIYAFACKSVNCHNQGKHTANNNIGIINGSIIIVHSHTMSFILLLLFLNY